LKNLLKNVRAKENRKNGITSAQPKKIALQKTTRNAIAHILGQSIYDHQLVKGHGATVLKINACKSVKDVLAVLQSRYKEVHGKDISHSKGRYNYWRYLNENNEDWQDPGPE